MLNVAEYIKEVEFKMVEEAGALTGSSRSVTSGGVVDRPVRITPQRAGDNPYPMLDPPVG